MRSTYPLDQYEIRRYVSLFHSETTRGMISEVIASGHRGESVVPHKQEFKLIIVLMNVTGSPRMYPLLLTGGNLRCFFGCRCSRITNSCSPGHPGGVSDVNDHNEWIHLVLGSTRCHWPRWRRKTGLDESGESKEEVLERHSSPNIFECDFPHFGRLLNTRHVI
jgi:hypothetical protein